MERLIGNWSRLEVRAVIRFLWAKNVSASVMSRKHVAELCHSFQSGRRDVKNRNMTGNGRPNSSMTEIKTARIEEMIQNDRQVTLREILSELGLSYGRVQHIVSVVLRYSKKVLRKHPPRPG
ncbi:histone-lysine N-methyltransferase SETMAR [Trichonephila clavipes]|nr:histone-lysine N-methyltransferase SETMAR [Trichonephila clavipes]